MSTTRTPENWVKKSFKLPHTDKYDHLILFFQSLGRLDISLIKTWDEMKDDLGNEDNNLKFEQHAFLSCLWVMAGFEVVRILKGIDVRDKVKNSYELFRRVRIPMVKFDAPKNKDGTPVYPTDLGIAGLAIEKKQKTLGWVVAHDTFISRDDLASAIYELY